jgi:superfamily II DNA or RNA helicase
MLVVHGTGTGKTYTAAMCARDFLAAEPENKVLFVSPLSVSAQAKSSILKVVGPDQLISFTTYDLMRLRLEKDAREVSRGYAMQSVKNAMIIADEAHYLTEDAKKTEVFTKVFSNAKKLLLFTATPVESGNPSDLLPYARMLNPGTEIAKIPADYEKYFKCKISFYETLSNSANFPRLEIPSHFKFNLTENERARFLAARGKGYEKNLGLLFGPNVFKNRVNPKYTKFLEIYSARPYKTIVYFTQVKPVHAFQKFLIETAGIDPKLLKIITGDTPAKNRTSMVRNDPVNSKTIFIVNSAGKEGLDFKGVRNIVFMNHPWGPSNQNQVIGRGKRYLSHQPLTPNQRTVKVFHLEYENTVNTASLTAITSKREKIRIMMDRLRAVSIESMRCTTRSPNRSISPQKRRTPITVRNRITGQRLRVLEQVPGVYRPLDPRATHYVTLPRSVVRTFGNRKIVIAPRGNFSTRRNLTGYTPIFPPSPPRTTGTKRLGPENNRPTKRQRFDN